jgi:hypothetical protein
MELDHLFPMNRSVRRPPVPHDLAWVLFLLLACLTNTDAPHPIPPYPEAIHTGTVPTMSPGCQTLVTAVWLPPYNHLAALTDWPAGGG